MKKDYIKIGLNASLACLLTVISACSNSLQTAYHEIVNETDTLKKYERFRTLFYKTSVSFTLYKDSVNENKFAIFSFDSTKIKLYQLIEKRWTLTDSVIPAIHIDNIIYRHLNNDRYLDIIAQSDTRPNDRNIVFMFNEKIGRFMHNSDYDMSHVFFDNMTLSSKKFYDNEKRHWEQTSYRLAENGSKVPYRSYEISSSNGFAGHINYFQYNKGQKTVSLTDSGKVEGLWYSGIDWIESLSRDYHIWYKDNLK